MLSVVAIKSSSIKNGYHLGEDGNYYIEESSQKGLYQWIGKGAAQQGLKGAITEQSYKQVFNGVLPSGDRVGRRDADGSLAGRPGYDLTFSMNKDISLIICCSGQPELKEYFLKAHIDSVKTAMSEAEKMVSARKTVKGETKYEPTQKMIAALCTHFSSRAGDPQVHTHALIANATVRSDGQWRALSTDMQRTQGFYENIRDNATYLGQIYQNEMAKSVKEKGFSISSVNKHGMFAIDGFPNEIRDHFSKRRKQIEKIVDSLPNADKNDKIVMNNIAQQSKVAKVKTSERDLMKKSRAEMNNFMNESMKGKDFDTMISQCLEKSSAKEGMVGGMEREAVLDAINALSVFQVKLDPNKIIEKAMAFDHGGSSLSNIQKALDDCIENKQVLQSDSGHLTSHRLIKAEHQLTSEINKSMRGSKPVLGSASIDITSNIENNPLFILKEPRSLSEKTKVIDELIESLESSGKKVTLLTQTKTMAESHNQWGRDNSTGLWQRLKTIGKSDRAQSIHGFIHNYSKDSDSPIKNALTKKGKEVFIIERADSLGLSMTQNLIALCERRKAKLIFLSNDAGVKSSLSGNAIEILRRAGVQTSKVKEKSGPNKEFRCHIHGDSVDLNATTKEQSSIRQSKIAKVFLEEYKKNTEGVQVFSSSRNSEKKQTDLIRESLRSAGVLGEKELTITTEKNVYLSTQERKHAKFFKKGWVARTYLGKGQFEEKEIIRIDKDSNKLLIEGILGRKKQVSPTQLLKGSDTQLIEKNTLNVAHNERLKLNTESKKSKQLGLSTNSSYIVSIEKNKMTLTPTNTRLKSVKAGIKRLGGLDIEYDYAKTINQNTESQRTNKKAILESPSYALNKGVIKELSRRYTSLDIYTDNERKAEKKIGIEATKPLALDVSATEKKSQSPVEKAVDFGLSVTSSRQAAFDYKLVLQRSLDYSKGNVSFAQAKEELGNRVRSGDLQVRESETGSVLLATKDTIKIENTIIKQIKEGKGAVSPFMRKEDIEKRLAQTNLTTGQKEACSLLASTRDRFVMIQGYAGTGKSTMLQTLKDALEKGGGLTEESIIALAPTHKAVKELKEKGMNAQTLKSFLIENSSPSSLPQKQLNGKLVLLDESSMVSNKDFHALQLMVEKSQSCHCAYIGDKAQLLSVEAGKPSELAYISKEAGIALATMDEVLRQKEPGLKSIALDLMVSSKASIEKALGTFEEKGWVAVSEEPIKSLAKDYAALPDKERQETLIAIATNKNRNLVNDSIRQELEKNKTLKGPTISFDRLIDSRLTNEQLLHSSSYQRGNVVKLNGTYHQIISIDHKQNTIEMKGAGQKKSTINLGQVPSNSIIELFQKESMSVQSGDQLKWTKSDKDRGVTAHETLQVVHVNTKEGQVQAKSQSGEVISIDLKKKQNQHIDYGYASTVHGLQGATAKSVMILLDGKNQQSNNMRLMYVAATRATHQSTLYSNDWGTVKRQITQNSGDKHSALEAMGLLEKKSPTTRIETAVKSRADLGSAIENVSESTKRSMAEPRKRIDAKQVEESMRNQCKQVCTDILGKPNPSLSNETNWRYGRKGSLSVLVDGSAQGSFCNFETGEKGGMIQLLMTELGIDFKTALEQAERMVGGDVSAPYFARKATQPKVTSSPSSDNKKQAFIDSLANKSTPISHGPAAKYLVSRKIEHIWGSDIRELKRVSTGGGNKETQEFSSAMIALARDGLGKVSAVQLTYLNPQTGEKVPNLSVPKRTIGSLQGTFVQVSPTNEASNITFVAEGVETALSINQSLKSMGHSSEGVLCSLGKSNLKKIPEMKTAPNVVVVLDNDLHDWKKDTIISEAITQLEKAGKRVFCIEPSVLNGAKTDYNDLLQSGESSAIERDLQGAIDHFGSKERVSEKNLPDKNENKKSINREIF